MTETGRPDAALRRAGLSATGKTVDELDVGESRAGTSYDDPAGPGTAYRETTGGDAEAELGQPSTVPYALQPSEDPSPDVADEG
jgi:hypothetical protein